MRTCTKCREEKPELDFYVRLGKSSPRCKSCELVYKKEYDQRKREEAKLLAPPPDPVITHRVCACCLVEKPLEEFRKRKNRPYGRGYHCKLCSCHKTRVHYSENREDRVAYSRDYRKENPEKIKENRENWFARNPGYPVMRAMERYYSDPEFRIRVSLRSRLRTVLQAKGIRKRDGALRLLGCPVPYFVAHMESLFVPGMTWENHANVWEMDHIKPCAKFDLTDPEQQKTCFHWTNFQPLFVCDNRNKRDRYDGC